MYVYLNKDGFILEKLIVLNTRQDSRFLYTIQIVLGHRLNDFHSYFIFNSSSLFFPFIFTKYF